jgi:hypothetical protein
VLAAALRGESGQESASEGKSGEADESKRNALIDGKEDDSSNEADDSYGSEFLDHFGFSLVCVISV